MTQHTLRYAGMDDLGLDGPRSKRPSLVRIIAWFLIGAVALGILLLGFYSYYGQGDAPETPSSLAQRVIAYRKGGSTSPMAAVSTGHVTITKRDYELMGADNSCARIAAGDRQVDEGYVAQAWFTISPGWKDHPWFPNSTYIDDVIESALLSIPLPEYQVTPEEVVWHLLRVEELRRQSVPQEERMRRMNEERKSKPWLKK